MVENKQWHMWHWKRRWSPRQRINFDVDIVELFRIAGRQNFLSGINVVNVLITTIIFLFQIYHLPLKIDLANKQQEKDNPVDFQMKIAWRYQGNAEASSMPSSSVPHKFGHQFDLMANFPLETVDAADITVWPKNIGWFLFLL